MYPTLPQEPLQLLSQLASQPSTHFDSSTLWNQYRNIDLSPTYLNPHHTFPHSSIQPHLQDQTRIPTDEVHRTDDDTPTRQRATGVSIFNSNAAGANSMFAGSNELAGFAFDCNGSITEPALAEPRQPSLDDTFNFDLLFGLDQPVLLPPAPPTNERIGRGVFDIPNFDSWTQEPFQNSHAVLGKHSRLCSPVTLEPSDQPIITYFLQTVSRAAVTRYVSPPPWPQLIS